jgi:hypothetical protein
MIDDDYDPAEGDRMPSVWWRVADHIPLTVRYRTSHIPTLAPLVFSSEFYGTSLSVHGPLYLDLKHFTRFNPTRVDRSAHRHAFHTLTTAFPDTFTTVLGGREAVWLALRLTRLTEPIADALLDVRARALALDPATTD